MKKSYFIIAVILFISCVNKVNKMYDNNNDLCVIDFWYERKDEFTTGSEGIVSILKITDKNLRKILLSNTDPPVYMPSYLSLKYSGGIYNIYNVDSLHYFSPSPNIININDSILSFFRKVYRYQFGEHSDSFIDSIIDITKKELVIEITNTENGETWLFPNCNCSLTTGVDWLAMSRENEERKLKEYLEEMEREEQIKAKGKVIYYLYNFFNRNH